MGHFRTVCILTVGISGLDKVRPVITHLSGQVVMHALEWSPALCQGFKKEPQINGMKGTHIVPPRNIRLKTVVITGFLFARTLFIGKQTLYGTLNPIHFCKAAFRFFLYSLRERQEGFRFFSENFLCLLLQLLHGRSRDGIREFIPGISRHHRHIDMLSLHKQHQRIPNTEFVIHHCHHHGKHFYILGILIPNGKSIQLSCLLQSGAPQECQKMLSVLLCLPQGFRCSDTAPLIWASNHGTHHHRLSEQTVIIHAGHLTHDASTACRLP